MLGIQSILIKVGNEIPAGSARKQDIYVYMTWSDSVEQRRSDADNPLAAQTGIPRIFYPAVYYHVHKSFSLNYHESDEPSPPHHRIVYLSFFLILSFNPCLGLPGGLLRFSDWVSHLPHGKGFTS
jgi:hypothetical protein